MRNDVGPRERERERARTRVTVGGAKVSVPQSEEMRRVEMRERRESWPSARELQGNVRPPEVQRREMSVSSTAQRAYCTSRVCVRERERARITQPDAELESTAQSGKVMSFKVRSELKRPQYCAHAGTQRVSTLSSPWSGARGCRRARTGSTPPNWTFHCETGRLVPSDVAPSRLAGVRVEKPSAGTYRLVERLKVEVV